MTLESQQQRIINSRRSFLIGLLGIITGVITTSCSNTRKKLKILLLEDSIPLQSISDYRKYLGKKIDISFRPSSQLKEIYNLLQDWHLSEVANNDSLLPIANKNEDIANLVTLGDSWLKAAIQQNSLQPLNIEQLDNWTKLPQPWQKLVRRNSKGQPDPQGQIWGAPYRWGSVVIAYRKDKFQKLGWTPSDWDDLWREELSDRLSVLNSPRETIGLTLKKLGYSYNTEDLERVPNLESELLALHRQVKLYSSDTYLQPLILGDTWLAVAWSADVLAIGHRYSDIEFVIPRSGTSLWADLWVQPQLPDKLRSTDEEIAAAIAQWLDFCWQPKAAQQISLFTSATSPVLVGSQPQELPKSLQNNRFLDPEAINFTDSEFLLPLSDRAEQQYRDLWLKIRQATATQKDVN